MAVANIRARNVMKKIAKAIFTRKETIRGVVVPRDWDSHFQVTGMLIACKGEREIRVENLNKFPHLVDLSQQEALITGTIKSDGAIESIVIEKIELPTQVETG